MDPFERLLRTHRRLEERLDELTRAAAEHDHQTLVDVLDFFDRAIARHEADEEQSLFPRVPGLAPIILALTDEHRQHAALQKKLRAGAESVDWSQIAAVAAEITAGYRRHIAREETELFPAARPLLDDAARAAMAAEMEARRARV